ncbi:MAG: (2Fe-2S)-binding protein [Pseudomonadaceae bacterium]|nr:(2Fe-2S)-binding protein [Pseudomonadaceae bacterium]
MYVCLCKAVTDRQLDEAIERGDDSLEALQNSLGVATGCGCCQSFVEQHLEHAGCMGNNASQPLYYAAG